MRGLFFIPDKALALDAPEYAETLAQGKCLRVERIVSHGQVTPEGIWYDQEQDEWVAVLEGSARLLWDDGRETCLDAGDHVFIPRHARHRVTRTSAPCIWLAIFGDFTEIA